MIGRRNSLDLEVSSITGKLVYHTFGSVNQVIQVCTRSNCEFASPTNVLAIMSPKLITLDGQPLITEASLCRTPDCTLTKIASVHWFCMRCNFARFLNESLCSFA